VLEKKLHGSLIATEKDIYNTEIKYIKNTQSNGKQFRLWINVKLGSRKHFQGMGCRRDGKPPYKYHAAHDGKTRSEESEPRKVVLHAEQPVCPEKRR